MSSEKKPCNILEMGRLRSVFTSVICRLIKVSTVQYSVMPILNRHPMEMKTAHLRQMLYYCLMQIKGYEILASKTASTEVAYKAGLTV